MLTYFMGCRGLKRLEGELNTIRLQTNSQAALQIDDWELPQEFCLHTGSVPHRLLAEMLEHLPTGLKGEFLQSMINTQPNSQMVRDALLQGETVAGARLERGCHIPDRLTGGLRKIVVRRIFAMNVVKDVAPPKLPVTRTCRMCPEMLPVVGRCRTSAILSDAKDAGGAYSTDSSFLDIRCHSAEFPC